MRWLGSADFFDKERHEVLIETLTGVWTRERVKA
jgi:hypothetical protein